MAYRQQQQFIERLCQAGLTEEHAEEVATDLLRIVDRDVRDRFASLAMQSLVKPDTLLNLSSIASEAYQIAAAMMQERAKWDRTL